MLKFSLQGAAVTLLVIAIGGCAGHTETTTAGNGLLPTLSRVADFSALAPAAVKVTGTYEGSVKKTESGHSKTGKITFIIRKEKEDLRLLRARFYVGHARFQAFRQNSIAIADQSHPCVHDYRSDSGARREGNGDRHRNHARRQGDGPTQRLEPGLQFHL